MLYGMTSYEEMNRHQRCLEPVAVVPPDAVPCCNSYTAVGSYIDVDSVQKNKHLPHDRSRQDSG